MTIFDILKDTEYKIEQFTTEAIENLNSRIIEKQEKTAKNMPLYNVLCVKKKYV